MGRLIDISPAVSPQTAVWPGDVPFSRAVALDMHQGHNLTLSSVTTTVHVGAHADAPSHYVKDAPAIDAVALEAYVGPCEVVDCLLPRHGLIRPEHCAAALARGARRLLFRTLTQPDPDFFNTDFAAFSPEALRVMGQAGVVLVGIDTPSVDPFESKDLQAHQELMRFGIRNLEGLVLAHVAPGPYELIALPLKLAGADASPVRAVLRDVASKTF
jgi:arylformamidase